MQWTNEAEVLINSLLQTIPSLMRGLAENPMKEKAEEYAEEHGSTIVERSHAIAGFIIATPFPMRKHLKAALEKQGVAPQEFSKWIK